MAYLSKDSAEKWYDIILGIHLLKNSLKNKVPAFKNEIEEILEEITGINHFGGKDGQRKWLEKNQIWREGNKITKGDIPQEIVTGIKNLVANRNNAEHNKNMDMATYLGLFALMAKAIVCFSNTLLPEEIQAICDGNEPETDDRLSSFGKAKDASNSQAEDNSYKNKGASTAEDIGGVEVKVVETIPNYLATKYKLSFKNNNNFPISLKYECENPKGGIKGTEDIILLPKGKRRSRNTYDFKPVNIKLTVKKLQE